jgi:DNA polymerase-3 subunit gamma/tau
LSEKPYKVLALKYRPENFDNLIGQEVLVRTITNAINTNRIANAFLLTGIRGVGKTTTARIIARVLNCIGEDGKGSPTPSPCGVCSNCKSIKEDRHPDVLEMDAASRTGVDDIREIIENSRYLPTMARYKIFIIDEVHMLSKNAFNALLKTLEEPPAHVKFIFATTEIRKIPITILSRCQRFDLRRIDNETLVPFLEKISANENAQVERGALEMIAHASEGSVRDSLSLLDQAISHSDSKVTAEMARDMLGLADKTKVIDIFDNLAKGDTAAALAILKELYDASADPVLVAQDLLEFTYLVTKLKIMPKLVLTGFVPENEYSRAKAMAEKLGMSYLTRCWQMLLKGLTEAKIAPDTLAAVEMILIRLAYISESPSPAALVKTLQDRGTPTPASPAMQQQAFAKPVAQPVFASAPVTKEEDFFSAPVMNEPASEPAVPELFAPAMHEPAYAPQTEIKDFNALVSLFKYKKESLLYNWLLSDVSLIKFEQLRVELKLSPGLDKDFLKRVNQCLRDWTGENWVVISSAEEGGVSLLEQKKINEAELKKELSQHEDVNKILETFPGAYISKMEEVAG